jgi:uncharacterized protein (TIGR04255 family)
MTQKYKRPPITEAVIEIRFETPVEPSTIDKAVARFRDRYPLTELQNTLGLQLDGQRGSMQIEQKVTGVKLTSLDGTEVLMIGTSAFSASCLAPYPGWEAFYGRAEREWRDWKKVVGYRKIQRIGVRYINRIDVPSEPGALVRIEDYLNFYPQAPSGLAFPMTQYAMQVVAPLGEDNCNVVLNSTSVPSPLLNHASFVFDVDMSRDGDVPQKDDEVWAFVSRLRGHKNRVFESCVTDQAKALFSR